MNKKDLLKKVSKEVIPNPKREHARFNMTLGSFTKALKRQRMSSKVLTSLGTYVGITTSVGAVHGYSGHQGDLAFMPTNISTTVNELIDHCEEIMNRTVIGPEGPVVITHGSPLWVALLTDKKGLAILDVVTYKEEVRIILNTRD